MRELIIIHPAIVGIAGGIILAAMLFVPVWLHERKRRTAIQKKEASEVMATGPERRERRAFRNRSQLWPYCRIAHRAPERTHVPRLRSGD